MWIFQSVKCHLYKIGSSTGLFGQVGDPFNLWKLPAYGPDAKTFLTKYTKQYLNFERPKNNGNISIKDVQDAQNKDLSLIHSSNP